MVVTTTFYGSRGTLRSNILKQVLKHINFFGSLVNFPRQHRKIIFRVDKTAKNIWRKKLRKFLFQEKKTYYFNFFKILRELFFWLLAKNYRHGCQNRNLSTFRNFWGKLVFFQMEHVCKHLRISRWKNRAFIQKLFFRVFTTGNHASREMFRGKKDISFEKVFFLLSFLEFEWFRCLFAKLFSHVCQTTDHCAERNKWEN